MNDQERTEEQPALELAQEAGYTLWQHRCGKALAVLSGRDANVWAEQCTACPEGSGRGTGWRRMWREVSS